MNNQTDSLSVLVIDEQPDILAFFAHIFHANRIRPLLARSSDEAIGIAERGNIPIDLVLSNMLLRPDAQASTFTSASDVIDSIRQLRPAVRVSYMSACLDSGVIRIDLQDWAHLGLIDAVRAAARGQYGQLVRSVGGH